MLRITAGAWGGEMLSRFGRSRCNTPTTRVRRTVSVSSLAIAGALVLGGCDVISGPAGAASPKDMKSVPYTATPTVAVTTGCVASDFQLEAGSSGAYQADAVYSMVLLNGSGQACALQGAPPMTLTLESGSHESVSLGAAASEVVDIGPGQLLRIMIGSPGSCPGSGGPKLASGLSAGLPGGSLTDTAISLDVECGVPSVVIFTAFDAPLAVPPSAAPTPPASGNCSWERSDGCTYAPSTNNGAAEVTGTVTVIGGAWLGNVPAAVTFSCTQVSSSPNEQACTFVEPPLASGNVTVIASKGSSGSAASA